MEPWQPFDSLGDYSTFFHDETFDIFGCINFDIDPLDQPIDETTLQNSSISIVDDESLRLLDSPRIIFENVEVSSNSLQNIEGHHEAEEQDSESQLPLIPFGATANFVEFDKQDKLNTDNMAAPPPSKNEEPRAKKTKKKWDKSIVIFPAKADSKKTPRQRRNFSKVRKKEVALTRRVGACIQCRLKKASCNLGLPCQQCIKRAGSGPISRELCTRQSLLAVRFDSIDLYPGYRTDENGDNLTYTLIPGTERTVYMSYPSCCSHAETWFQVQVQDHEGLSPPALELSTLISWNSDSWETKPLPDPPCWAFVETSIPSIDDLIDCKSGGKYHQCDSGPFAGLHKAFSSFGEHYCEIGHKLPLQSLLAKILRMKSIYGIYRPSAIIKEYRDSPEFEWAPTPMVVALDDRIRKALVEVEAEVLFEFERIIFGVGGIGKQNPLAVWVCLWLLILHYNSMMAWVLVMWHNDDEVLQPVHGLAKHLYHSLTAIYSALYRTTSPLMLDWRKDEISELLGKDPDLIRLFCDIKTEMYWFHGEKNRLYSGDALLKTLVVDNESKLVTARIKAAKRQGIL